MVLENLNDLQDNVENTEAKNENNAINIITAANPIVVDNTVKQNKNLEDAKTGIITTTPEAITGTEANINDN